MDKAYGDFVALVKELYALDQVASCIGWDEETFMPPGAVMDRAIQKSTLQGVIHEKLTSKKISDLIRSLEKSTKLNPDARVVVREVARRHRRATSIPKELVKEIAKTESLATEAWLKARKAKSFPQFEPMLKKMMGLKAKVAEHVGYEDRPYDALLDEYEPYMKTVEVESLFSRFRDKLVPLVSKIHNCSTQLNENAACGDFPIKMQDEFIRAVVKDMGYDFDHGRMDISAHPFTIGTGRDVRITVRYDEKNLRPATFAAIHEAGHGLYEQGFLEKYYHTPLAESISLGIHESQSRLWENIVARGMPFWKYYYPKLKAVFPAMESVPLAEFHKSINAVQRSYIRVEADEVTYNLHIMLRFEVENAIFEGKLKVHEIPSFWNERFTNYLGLKVPDDAMGCLQDIHWAIGAIGYFPTYSLGTIYATQLYNTVKKAIPDLEDQFAAGNFKGLLGWLRNNIHSQGKRYRATELIKKVTGEGLNEDYFLKYLKQKYGKIYGLSL